MSTMTRRVTTPAASLPDWHRGAACTEIGGDLFFEDTPTANREVQGVCRGCPVRVTCLSDAISYEDGRDGRFGVVGGLTPVQRRALRVEAVLGNRPDLRQAAVLASPVWAGFMHRVKEWPADMVTAELRRYRVLASPVTVRVALWWTGAKGSVLRPPAVGDQRQQWQRVHDEAREVVYQLREMGVGVRDLSAFLMVSQDALSRAAQEWRAEDAAAEEVAAA